MTDSTTVAAAVTAPTRVTPLTSADPPVLTPSKPYALRPALSPNDDITQRFFRAILDNQGERVRVLLTADRRLTTVKVRGDYQYDQTVELQAFKCLGAYLGALTGLQVAILNGQTGIALDIIDVTFDQDLDIPFGNMNSTLHLAVLLGDTDVTRALLERGANRSLKNGKGFTAVDLAFHSDISDLLSSL